MNAVQGVTLRTRLPEDDGPEGPWVVERRGRVVGAGGILHHYNPPWSDLYMEVATGSRRQGVGSFLVQELRRVCASSGRRAAARCDPGNEASRHTLIRGGLELRGSVLQRPLIDPLPGTVRAPSG